MLSEDERKAIKYFYNLRSTIDESYMLFDEGINIKSGKETIKQITLVLNLITKLQKENEDLKREKEENKIIIAMVNNEMLGYNQGYIDGKNQNSNATEIIIKNREFYKYKEEINFYKRKIKFLQKQLETIKEYVHQEIVSRTETIRDYIDDDKEGNKDIIGELKEEREHWKDLENKIKEEKKA